MKAEKAIMNSDMINDNNSIYIPCSENGLEFYKYPIVGDLFYSIRIAIDNYCNNTYSEPSCLFIPFSRYNNFGKEGQLDRTNLLVNCMKDMGVTIQLMVSDDIKEQVKPIIK